VRKSLGAGMLFSPLRQPFGGAGQNGGMNGGVDAWSVGGYGPHTSAAPPPAKSPLLKARRATLCGGVNGGGVNGGAWCCDGVL
jgi:hypothetical protein